MLSDRFVISFVSFLLMCDFACRQFCDEATCYRQVSRLYAFCALLGLIKMILRFFRVARYLINSEKPKQQIIGEDKASNSSDQVRVLKNEPQIDLYHNMQA